MQADTLNNVRKSETWVPTNTLRDTPICRRTTGDDIFTLQRVSMSS